MSAPTRRNVLLGAAGFTALAACAADTPARRGNIRHSAAAWCFTAAGEKWSLEKTCTIAKALGCVSIELIGPADLPIVRQHGLTCAIAGNGVAGQPFKYGFNNPRYQDMVIAKTKSAIDACAEAGVPSVIAFTGYLYPNADDPKSGLIPRDEAAANCVKGFKEVVGYAERQKVTICLEHLNTRDDSHPMKGHPGYHGDNLDEVAGIIRKVGSDRLKLLFDIYHVQIMHGDVIRRLEQCKDILGHIHTAGNPGRGELDDTQEIQYTPIMKKLVALGYKGFVGHEFIPTRDPRAGLEQAIAVCDV